MDDVKTRLAAAGWSDRTRGGKLIIFAASDDDGISLSGVIKVDRGVFAVNWDSSGKAYSRDNDLVPLPAPVQCPPVQKLATSGPSITRPVSAVDAWVTYGEMDHNHRRRVTSVETIDGITRIISGELSIPWDPSMLTGPTDRGPWRPIGEVR